MRRLDAPLTLTLTLDLDLTLRPNGTNILTMCCFSRSVDSVSGTSIFARPGPDGSQYLAYGMSLTASEELAMILPLPVAKGSGDDAVRFIDLSQYPEFFRDLASAFIPPQGRERAKSLRPSPRPLPVIGVGSFEASFVPTIADFNRLDARFRLPPAIWSEVQGYETFGFAVFKLKSGSLTVHPMAFSFPTDRPNTLFFPTLHIHDERVRPSANFDHALYYQATTSTHRWDLWAEWRSSFRAASAFANVDKSRGLLAPELPCYERIIQGRRENRDVEIDLTRVR